MKFEYDASDAGTVTYLTDDNQERKNNYVT